MSNEAGTAVTAVQQSSGFPSIDFILGSAQRVAEGVIGFQLLNSEVKARQAQAQWQAAVYNQAVGQQVGNAASPWGGVGGNSGIPMVGGAQTNALLGGSILLPVGIALAVAYFFLKD